MSISTEDKAWWVSEWRKAEDEFVGSVCPYLNLDVSINPGKEHNPKVPDLLVDGFHLADLKCQRAPFFSAGRYGMNPQTTVTFNHKDYDYYSRKYPSIRIYYWVRWEMLSYDFPSGPITVLPMRGVWLASFQRIAGLIDDGAPLHPYKRRVQDEEGNAKDSYLLDLNTLTCLGCSWT